MHSSCSRLNNDQEKVAASSSLKNDLKTWLDELELLNPALEMALGIDNEIIAFDIKYHLMFGLKDCSADGYCHTIESKEVQ